MSLEIITGPMFASKTTTLMGKYDQLSAIYDVHNILLLTSHVGVRGTRNTISTHHGESLYCEPVEQLGELITDTSHPLHAAFQASRFILMDEVQFFQMNDVKHFIQDALLKHNKHIIASGINTDSNGNAFPTMSYLLSQADHITHLKSYCHDCQDGTLALFSKYIANDESTTTPNINPIRIGGSRMYKAVCRKHFYMNEKE